MISSYSSNIAKSLVLFCICILFTAVMPVSMAEEDFSVSLQPAKPIASENFFFNGTLEGTGIAFLTVSNDSGELHRDWGNLAADRFSFGPLVFPEGEYIFNITFLILDGDSSIMYYEEEIVTVFPLSKDKEEMHETFNVVFAGISVVFLTLALLALATFVIYRVADKFVKEVKSSEQPPGEDIERIAAIAAAIRVRGG